MNTPFRLRSAAFLLTSCLSTLPAMAAGVPGPGDAPRAPWGVIASAASVAPITQVTLFPDSALIERVATIRAGATQLDIPGLPANFDVGALQIEADSGIEIGDTTIRETTRQTPLTVEEARLDSEIRLLRARIAAIDVDRKAAELELKYLDSLANPTDGQRSTNLSPMLQSLRQGSTQAQRRILDADAEKAHLEPRLAGLVQDLERIRPTVTEVRSLLIRLDAARDGKLRIRYPVADAGWRPAYRATLDADAGRIDLERTAQLAQRTGEDWNRVSLRLSTGQPRQRVSGATPTSWNLQLRPEARADAVREMAFAMAPADAPAMAKAAGGAGQAPLFQVSAQHGDYATEYTVTTPVSLPADGRRMSVSLEHRQVPVRLQVQVSPRQEKAGYLVARGEIPEGVWPAGEVRYYRSGTYVGAGMWDGSRSTRLELPFGRDDLVKVSTRSVTALNATSGLVGQSAERQMADVFTIANLHKRAMDVLVLEASPVGRDERIEVTPRFTPPITAENWDGRSGVVAWEQTLEAGASRDFSAEYRIRWPRERQILGLP